MSISWFNARKAAQIAAFFSNKQGENIPVLKLIKLIYLADRENMQICGYPILNDRLVSMPHGPVNSITYNYVNGDVEDLAEWEKYITPRLAYSVGATRVFVRDELDELSESELATLEKVWDRFGLFTKWQLRDWTHENCPEWEDPHGGADPIPHERVLRFLQVANADELADDVREDRHIEELFAQLRAQFMEWELSKQGSLLIPSGTTHDPNRKHLFVVCALNADEAFLAIISTWKNNLCDGTCTIEAGEHPFIVTKSYVMYRKCRVERCDTLVKGVEAGVLIPRPAFNNDVFSRICRGIEKSTQIPWKMRRAFLVWKE